jgi:hypothetical protein
VHNLNMGIRFDNEVMRFFYPRAWDPEWHASLLELSRDVARHGVGRMRWAVAFVGATDPRDVTAVKSFTVELAREVSRADLEFIGRIKTRRREMEMRIGAEAGPPARRRPRAAASPWAAESARLASSVGLEASTELLPGPFRF